MRSGDLSAVPATPEILGAAGPAVPTPPAGGRPWPHNRHAQRDRRGGSGLRECERAVWVPFLPFPLIGAAGAAAPAIRPGGDRGCTTGALGATSSAGIPGATGGHNPRDRHHRCVHP